MLKPTSDKNEAEAHQALTLLLKQEADRLGMMSFARFMELALYAPGLGFYERSENVIGRSGDFYTSVSVGRLFGELLACQFADWFKKTPLEQPVIIEAGAHNGRLALDILTKLRGKEEALFESITYWIVEPSARRQNWQKSKLAGFSDSVRWFQSWTDLSSIRDKHSPVEGLVFSNELLDALPFHRLQWDAKGRKWTEQGVIFSDGRFKFGTMPLSEAIEEYRNTVMKLESTNDQGLMWPKIPNPLLDVLPDGFVIEVSPQSAYWWQQAAQLLNCGRILTFDYGSSGEEFLSPKRTKGTTRGYHHHQHVEDVLANPGRSDITASVNFTTIQYIGHALGLQTEQFESQSRFLTRVLSDCLDPNEARFNAKQVREFQTLTHPNHLGAQFKVLVQSKGMSQDK